MNNSINTTYYSVIRYYTTNGIAKTVNNSGLEHFESKSAALVEISNKYDQQGLGTSVTRTGKIVTDSDLRCYAFMEISILKNK